MISRDRIQSAFAYRQPDSTPCDYFATPEIQRALLEHFRVDSEGQLRMCLGTDIQTITPPSIGPELPVFKDGSSMNIWGIQKKPMPNEYGDYMESGNYPYAEWTTIEDAEAFSWPDPDWYDYSAMPTLCAEYPEKALMIGSFSVQDFINGIAFGRGVEQVLIDIALEDHVFLYILDKRHRFYMEHIERILEAANRRIDLVLCADDFGCQRGLLISPTSFNKIFAQKKKEFFDMVHNYGAKVTHHCCGSSKELIPRFIELGMDALQTIQPQAEGMNPYELKKSFPGQIVLHGAVDVQGWLQSASVTEIEEEINCLIDVVGKDGGFILAPCHHIQPDTPIENVLALYRTIAKRRGGSVHASLLA
jgi:uroporphyrinogen decarboxylase